MMPGSSVSFCHLSHMKTQLNRGAYETLEPKLTWSAAKIRGQHLLAIGATLAHAKVDQSNVAS